MTHNENKYASIIKGKVNDHISSEINSDTIDQIVKVNLVQSHLNDKRSASFQIYYFNILENEEMFLSSYNFFKQFRSHYSLRSSDNKFVEQLERNKESILNHIKEDKLAELYFAMFSKVKIKHLMWTIEKDQGSFFAKLVHTFRPYEYCALDNPIKAYFGLKNESFFSSFYIISNAYKIWAADNKEIMTNIKNEFKKHDSESILNFERMSDLKLLDLIFWSKANRHS